MLSVSEDPRQLKPTLDAYSRYKKKIMAELGENAPVYSLWQTKNNGQTASPLYYSVWF